MAIKRIVFTGPESSGKTTLAALVADHLEGVLVPEFARYYLGGFNGSYQATDLKKMFAGQLAWEAWFAQKLPDYLICDTDWTVFEVWSQRFCPDVRIVEKKEKWDMAFLCSPDVPWVPDPLREHPDDREALFEEYKAVLEASGWPYCVIAGDVNLRLAHCLSVIKSI